MWNPSLRGEALQAVVAKDQAAVRSAVQLAAPQSELREGRDGGITDNAGREVETPGKCRLASKGHDPLAHECLRSIA